MMFLVINHHNNNKAKQTISWFGISEEGIPQFKAIKQKDAWPDFFGENISNIKKKMMG